LIITEERCFDASPAELTIVDHAFYLAIEGGTNRTSGLAVQGVGATNRAATIQAARDLYGVNSAAERAVTQAWTAVGVN
jgi:Zn-dependent metalloprotease